MRGWIACVVFVIMSARPVSARTVKVTTYPELLAACHSAQPNDTILLAPGTYAITGATRIMISSRPGPVVVKGTTGNPADVIVEGQGQDNEAVSMVFDLDNSPRWTFQDLTTRNSYYHGFKFNGSSTDCILRHVVMRDHGESGVKGTSNPALGVYPDRLLVERCDIGFSQGHVGTRSVVEGIDGVGVKDWVVRGSRFVNVTKGKSDVAYAVFTKGNAQDTIIEGNRFEGCDIGASFGGGGTGPAFFRDNDRAYEHRGGIIRNNVFVRCRDAAIYINRGRDCKIYNNTLFECVLSIQLRFTDTRGWVRNNLVKPAPANPEEPALRVRDGATLLTQEANRTASEVDFVRASGKDSEIDVHLRPTSSAVDTGVEVKADVPTDYDGKSRPFGKRVDIGAFEWRMTP